MTAEYTQPFSPEQTPHVDTSPNNREFTWQRKQIDGETFLVIKDLPVPTTIAGKDVVFLVDEYHHPETDMKMSVYKLGTDRPKDEPTIVRADYTCPCMNLGPKFHLPSHDCSQQRELMFETMTELGTGVMAIISEQTAAGNGHGSHAVHQQAAMQYEAAQKGLAIPTMQEAYSQMGYFDDIRRHDIVAKVLADVLDGRPAIATTSNVSKLQQFEQAGMHIIPNVRVELMTEQSATRQQMVGRRHYDHVSASGLTPGPYIIENGSLNFIPLTRESYQQQFIQKPVRRLVN